MTELWNTFFFQPMLNGLLLLYDLLGHNFALSIAFFTIAVRLLTLPLTMQQLRSSKVMQELQPELQRLQKKYAKDKEKLAEEQMRLYRERGINPLGGCLPMLVQFPIWIGLYQSIIQALSDSPLQLMKLAQHIYQDLPAISAAIPVQNRFLWLHLGRPDPIYILPALVVITTWLQQKMISTPSADPQQASMSQTMEVTMPLIFGFITLQLASGLALYFLVSNLIGIVMQGFITGWGSILPQRAKEAQPKGKRYGRKKR